jgi:hypothetical protein
MGIFVFYFGKIDTYKVLEEKIFSDLIVACYKKNLWMQIYDRIQKIFKV